MATVEYGHVVLSSTGVPFVAGTQIKVVEIVMDQIAHGWDADEIHRQHPNLTLSQIHSALAYYYDHRREIDEDIERRLRETERIRTELGESAVRLKLRALGHLP
jgi:uncharacterized protein (DUF433 family)